jgi:glycosyltransferase involved in cell wall biosynthesis
VDIAARLARGGPGLDHATHVHAHFAHDPALVGLLLARLTGLGFTFTAHAKDLYQIPADSLAARARAARAVVTCCAANADHIRRSVPDVDLPPLLVVHHGVDLHRFAPARGLPAPATGVRLLSVGRLVEKKGFTDLLRALALLRGRDVAFTLRLCGAGPLHASLVELRDRLGLIDSVNFLGARTQEEVTAAMAEADAFVLTPLVTDDGDRDGIPTVLVEAMASALPVTTTAVGGIPELVTDGVNGRLLREGDVAGVADALQQLAEDPLLRARLGAAARRMVEECYDVDAAACRLREVFAGRRPRSAGVVA